MFIQLEPPQGYQMKLSHTPSFQVNNPHFRPVYIELGDPRQVKVIRLGGVTRLSIYYMYLVLIGHLHDDIILPLRPESFRILLSCANQGFCYSNLTGITKFKYERKNGEDYGRGSKMTPSCKWPILSRLHDRWGDLPLVTPPVWGSPSQCKKKPLKGMERA